MNYELQIKLRIKQMLKCMLHRKRLTADIQIPAISDAKCLYKYRCKASSEYYVFRSNTTALVRCNLFDTVLKAVPAPWHLASNIIQNT